ncbi:MAG: ATP-dependent helicase HrpA [Deltaproteobacteria bacterium]|nr:ATP-dependent helicase HrpA [Deltaproteobacteria bacterium]
MLPDLTQPEGPDDPARERRLDWAKLLKRAFAIDVLVCPRCAGPMRLIALIDDERIARKILTHLGLPTRAVVRQNSYSP